MVSSLFLGHEAKHSTTNTESLTPYSEENRVVKRQGQDHRRTSMVKTIEDTRLCGFHNGVVVIKESRTGWEVTLEEGKVMTHRCQATVDARLKLRMKTWLTELFRNGIMNVSIAHLPNYNWGGVIHDTSYRCLTWMASLSQWLVSRMVHGLVHRIGNLRMGSLYLTPQSNSDERENKEWCPNLKLNPGHRIQKRMGYPLSYHFSLVKIW